MTPQSAAAPAGAEQSAPEVAAPDPVSLGEALDKMFDKIAGWVEDLVVNLPNIAAAIVVVLLFGLVARLASRLARKALGRTRAPAQVVALAAAVVSLVVMIAGVFAALGVVGLEKTVTSLLAGAGIIGLAISFAFQDIATNFIAGVYLAVKRPLSVGDVVETNSYFGTVVAINLRTLDLRVPQGMIVRIPNKMVFENPFTEYSTGEQRVDVNCGVSYGDDLARAREVAVAAIEAVPQRKPDRAVEFFWQEIGGSSIDFVVRFWIPFQVQSDMLAAQSEAVERLKNAFDAAGISMPFPITTLDFSRIGGETLAEQLAPWRPPESGGEEATTS